MKAVVYDGPKAVSVKEVPDARIERPTDALVRITTTDICGSDLHMYDGRTDLQPGRVLGHENLGEVIEVGDGVDLVKVGDIVCLPLPRLVRPLRERQQGPHRILSRGQPRARYGRCRLRLPGQGPYSGGQAELLRVPWADFNYLLQPPDARDLQRQRDYVMPSDIFSTGRHGTQLACGHPGDTVTICGGGPVGLMAAMSAFIKRAGKVMVVDRHPDRLRLAEQIGAVPIDDSKASPVDQIKELAGGLGADRGCECVGYQAHDPQCQEHSGMTLNNLVQSVKFAERWVWSASSPHTTRAARILCGSRARCRSTTACSGSRGRPWAPASAMSRTTTAVDEPDRGWQGETLVHRVPRAEAGRGAAGNENFDRRVEGWTKVLPHSDGRR